jgi:carbonic anhydrase
MNTYERLLLENKAWSKEKQLDDPQYFLRMAKDQTPEFLWIGCSDSRVPANEVTNTDPGEIFVHRNIANMVVHTDLNLLSVLQYAVDVLKVKHIIVCGHYGCGGVKAALGNQNLGIINKWLRNIKDVYSNHRDEIDRLENLEAKTDKLVELNVKEQVLNLAKTSIIQNAWRHEQRPHLHGWVYDLKDGVLQSIFDMNADSELDPIYKYDNL